MKANVWILMAAMVLCTGCFNFFHDLVPPNENRIVSFELAGQIVNEQIGDTSISVLLGKTENLRLIPQIRASNGATIFPVTLDYIRTSFPNANIAKEMGTLLTSRDMAAALIDLIKRTPNFTVPSLTRPIDFSGPVSFLVMSGQGSVRQYTVQVNVDNGEPRLLSFGFSKYDNAELVKDGFALVQEQTKTVTAAAVYPVDMPALTYQLIPSFQILGDNVQIEGTTIRSGLDAVPFAASPSLQTKTITVTRDGQSVNYDLNLNVREDPETQRSITDFRFTGADNPGIAANAVAAIIHGDTTGTITVQVFYTGTKPTTLKARFVSPGTVSVAGATQTGGLSQQDFSSPLDYQVVSKNGQYTRIYTVRVELFSLTNDAPKMTSFRFTQAANPELVQDSQGEISGGNILIDAKYGGNVPDALAPEFTAEGLVTVNGAAQTSGISEQDFSRQIKYTVRHPLYSELKTDYWVQVRLSGDSSSAAQISAFSFHPNENSNLAETLEGTIDQREGTITVSAPAGSGVTSEMMFPRFTAQGQVKVDGNIQASGVSGHIFNAPVVYTVTSANGLYQKTYTVNIIEIQEAPEGFVWVADGTFTMGSPITEQDRGSAETQHSVTLTGFYMAKYQVTQELYRSVMGNNPSYFTGDDKRPVEMVSWYDAVEFCNKLSLMDGLTPAYTIDKNTPDPNNTFNYVDTVNWTVTRNPSANGYRLPTDAEWEYAARGGTKWNNPYYVYPGSNNVDEVSWYDGNSGGATHPVGGKKPNGLGIYDMSGNVFEWCWDWSSNNTDPAFNPQGASSGSRRAIRGSNWKYSAADSRSACQFGGMSFLQYDYIGFRLVRP